MTKFRLQIVTIYACVGLLLILGHPAGADTITVGGARYKDVLVLKSSSSYYIQIPWEGRTVSVRAEDVDESKVEINDDPYYRDRLKEEYRAAKQLRDAGQSQGVQDDEAFRVREPSNDSFQVPTGGGKSAGAGGGGGGGGGGDLGVPRTQVEQGLTAFGVQFQPGPGRGGEPSVVGEMASNGTHFELFGPPERLAGLEIKATVPADQIGASTQQLKMFVMQMDPTLSGQFDAMIQEAQSSGRSTRNVEGIAATVTITENGENVNFVMNIVAAN